MLHFFRQIRKSLMEQHKVRTYLLYAVGEIALVMIGILLALQVNNWNIERQERQKEQEILKALKVEFQANLYDLQRVSDEHELIYSELSEIQHITESRNYEDPRLDSLIHGVVRWFTFTERPSASSNLINSGNLNLITNDELRDLITQWSGTVADVVDDEVYTADFIRETMLPFLAAHYPITNLEPENNKFVKRYASTFNILYEPILSIREVEWEKLLNNEEFQSLIAMRKIYEMHCALEIVPAIEACIRTLELIEEEMN